MSVFYSWVARGVYLEIELLGAQDSNIQVARKQVILRSLQMWRGRAKVSAKGGRDVVR